MKIQKGMELIIEEIDYNGIKVNLVYVEDISKDKLYLKIREIDQHGNYMRRKLISLEQFKQKYISLDSFRVDRPTEGAVEIKI